MNGIALHGGIIPFGGTFLVFSDYMRPAIRLAALMGTRVVYVFTHDSIGLGEDGPTHQPIEQLAALRAIPNLAVLRPADATETAAAWSIALERKAGPTALVLSRQKLPVLDRKKLASAELVENGAYILSEASKGTPDVMLLATGSEVSLALDAQQELESQNIATRVVSMPSWELFDAQPRGYQDEVLPPAVTARLAIEAASPMGWHKYVGTQGDILGIETFGASAPADIVMKEFGFSVQNVVERALTLQKAAAPAEPPQAAQPPAQSPQPAQTEEPAQEAPKTAEQKPQGPTQNAGGGNKRGRSKWRRK